MNSNFLLDPANQNIFNIRNINFTPREIDIIACLLNARGTNKISSLLSILPKTVRNHIHNIMIKIDCNSRDEIIDCIENSDKVNNYRAHYSNLLVQANFQKCLNEILKFKKEHKPSYKIISFLDCLSNNSFVNRFGQDLKYAGIKISVEVKKLDKVDKEIIQKQLDEHNYIYIFPKNTIDDFFKKENTCDLKLIKFNEIVVCISRHFCDSKFQNDAHKQDILTQINYYYFVLEILNFLLFSNIKKFISDFKQQHDFIQKNKENSYPNKILENKNSINNIFNLSKITNTFTKYIVGLALFTTFMLGSIFFALKSKEMHTKIYKISQPEPNSLVKSDFVLPKESLFLHRTDMLSEIENKLLGTTAQNIALIGVGGAGKTTLARQYAKSQRNLIIWELSANSRSKLKDSFECLAQALAKDENGKRILKDAQQLKSSNEKEEKILQFVKERLQSYNDWLLIYDNVAKLADIIDYFPCDDESWGRGKVIVTTRDVHIKNNIHINNSIFISELTNLQKLNLFFKIINQGKPNFFKKNQNEKLKALLEHIPPFPLDVSIAAYYLKTTNISCEKYIEYLQKGAEEFSKIQQIFLQEAGEYIATRYNIVKISIEEIIKTNPDFIELLFFLSVLDSENITRELLSAHSNDIIADNFIYCLEKHSLLNNQYYDFSKENSFLIHKSSQSIIFDYLVSKFKLMSNHGFQKRAINTLKNYTYMLINQDNRKEIGKLLPHWEKIKNHRDDLNLKNEDKGNIDGFLGIIYYYLKKAHKSIELINAGLPFLNKNEVKNYVKFLTILSASYRILGNNEDAKFFLEKALSLHKSKIFDDPTGLVQILSHLGAAYRELGEYEKSKKVLEEGIAIDEKASNNIPGIARTWANLGTTYKLLGERWKAKDCFEKSLKFFQTPGDPYDIAWISLHLGNIWLEIGDYKQAKNFFEQSLTLYKLSPEDHVRYAWALESLGNLYDKLGEFQDARYFLEKALKVYKAHPKDHSGNLRVLTLLGRTSLNTKNYEKAKYFLNESLNLYRKEPFNHSYNIQSLTLLAATYIEQDNFKEARILLEEAIKNSNHRFGSESSIFLSTLVKLGHVFLLENNLEAAESLFNRALFIWKKNGSPNVYIALEALAELYLKKSKKVDIEKVIPSSERYRKQASNYLKKALDILETQFSKESPYATKIRDKIKKENLL